MFCPNCGSQIEDGSAFCPQCGANCNVDNNQNSGPMNQGPMNQGQMGYGPMNQGQMNQGQMGHGQMGYGQMGYGQMNRNAGGGEFVKLFKDAFEEAKKFLSAPRQFIKNFISNENSNKKLPIPFMVVEGVLVLLFSFICNSSLKDLVKYYAMQSAGSSSSYSAQIQFAVDKMLEGTMLTIFLWTLIIAALVWVCKFIISKVATTPANQSKVFSLLSVFATINIIQWVLNIIFVILFFGALKINPQMIQSMSSGYSSSSNPLAQLSAVMGMYKGIMLLGLLFTIMSTLLYTFNVFAVKRTTDELETTDGLPAKKATTIVIVFAVALIIINNYSFIFVLWKVIEKIMANAMNIGKMMGSGFGF